MDFKNIYEIVQELFDAGKYEESERLLLEIIEDSRRQYADVYNKLGFIAHNKGDLKKAVEYLEMALSLNPRYTEASLNLAITFNELERYEEADEVFAKAVNVVKSEQSQLDPFIQGKLANDHAALGERYYEIGLYDKALEEYNKSLELRPKFVDIIVKLGIAQREKGLLDDSIETFSRAKEINPKYTSAFIHLGITYYIKGFFNLAMEEWETASKIDPNARDARLYRTFAKKESI
ncbi:MAG: tetratricopeptide repeat protein [Nitrospirota bacterium]